MSNSNACAYPTYVGDPGLTKRELIAAMAMQGAAANTEFCRAVSEYWRGIDPNASHDLHNERCCSTLARRSVQAADALLTALSETKSKE